MLCSPLPLHTTTAIITCSALLGIVNGMIVYSSNTTAPYVFGTTATYHCNEDYSLIGGDGIRTCSGDDSKSNGVWNGQTPTCSGNLIIRYYDKTL